MPIEFEILQDAKQAAAEWDRAAGQDNQTMPLQKKNNKPTRNFSTFNLNDKVTWTSQAVGSHITKTGRVVAVVPSGKDPLKSNRSLINSYLLSRRALGGGKGRDHESYLIEADSKLYWPRVSALQKAKR